MGFQKLQEVLAKPDYKDILETVKYPTDESKKPYFDYEAYNVFGTGYMQSNPRKGYNVKPMGQEDAGVIAEMVKNIPFNMMAQEFLGTTTTTGYGGAGYLIPTKIYNILQTYASPEDIINDVSSVVIPAAEIPGSTLDIDIAKRSSYKPHATASGGKAPEEELGFTKATLNFSKTLTVNFNIGNDLVEDSQFSLMEVHMRMAGAEMGKRSTTEVLSVMSSTTDGDGTLNTQAASEDAMTIGELWDALEQVIIDEFKPDRILGPMELLKQVFADVTYTAYSTDFHNAAITGNSLGGLFGLTWIRCDHPSLWTETSNLPTDCIGYVFAKDYSYISGRKRWLRIENYSDPIRDLVGAVVSSRQDTVSIYDDSVCKISE